MFRHAIIVGLVVSLLTSPSVRGQDASAVNVSSMVPQVVIETTVPGEINIGASAQFVISVKNSGKSVAEGVSIQATLPPAVKFVKANPHPSMSSDRMIQFEVGDLPPGSVRRFALELIPEKTGPVDLQTKAFFSATTQSALQVRQAEVTIHCHGPATAQLGENVTFRVVVENIGDGAAENVVLTPELPEGSYIQSQPPRAAKIAVLAAGRSQEVGGTRVSFVRSEGEYELRTWNPGDTVLRDIKLALQLPEGLDITTLSETATIDRPNRIYSWCLDRLNPGDSHTIHLKTTATKVGRQIQLAVAMSGPKLRADSNHLTHVISRAEVDVAVSNVKEAIPVGQMEEFTVALTNSGSRDAETVSVKIQLPEGIEAVTADGYVGEGQQITFARFRLTPGGSKTLKFRAVGLAAGDQAVRAVVETEYSPVPTIAETTVYFYDDDELLRIARELDAAIRLR